MPETCTAGDTERGDELPSKDEADIFAFTESDIDKGWTGLRPGDIVAFVPSPTATLGKNTPKVRQNPSRADSAADAGINSWALEVSEVVYRGQPRPRAIAIVLEKPADEKRTVGFVVLLKDSFGFIKTAEHENNVRGRLGGDGVLAPGKLTRYHPAPCGDRIGSDLLPPIRVDRHDQSDGGRAGSVVCHRRAPGQVQRDPPADARARQRPHRGAALVRRGNCSGHGNLTGARSWGAALLVRWQTTGDVREANANGGKIEASGGNVFPYSSSDVVDGGCVRCG